MPEPTTHSPKWRILGGTFIIIASVLDLMNYLFEAFAGAPASSQTMFWTSTILDVVSGVLWIIATFWLAFGGSRHNGVVGSSVLGKAALLTYGGTVLIGDIVFLGYYFLTDHAFPILHVIVLVLEIIGLVAALFAGIVIFQKNVAHQIARWSLFVALVIGVIALIVSTPDAFVFAARPDIDSVVLHTPNTAAITITIIAIVSRLYVGITYLFNGKPKLIDLI
jgi:uncharacterized membrane protein